MDTMEFEDAVLDKDTNDIDYYDMREYADDIEFIRKTLMSIGINTSHLICYYFWNWWSLKLDASWLVVSKEEILSVVKNIKKYV